MKRQEGLWGISGLLLAGLLIITISIIDDRPPTEFNLAGAGVSPAENNAVAPALEPSVAPEQIPAAAEFDPEVEALSDADIEMRMAGLPARQD